VTTEDVATIAAMKRYGGSFVRALGEAASHADPDNLRRLKEAFPTYWKDYSEKATAALARGVDL
jgi:hypothetical protein